MRALLFTLCTAALTSLASAQIAPYSQDFEGLDQASPTALADDGWLVFGNVFDLGGGYIGGYGPFPAPNGGPGFCAIAAGEGGPDQGAQQLVVYSDYNNPDQACCLVEANTFQEQIVSAGDVGKAFTFTFDAKLGDIQPNSTAIAFIKVIDNVTFGLSAFETVDMTSIPTTWSTFSLSTTIDAGQVGHFFQIGFAATATAFTPSGIVYDNIVFGESAAPTLAPYKQDFEGLDMTNPSALADDGWLVFGNVFDLGGGYIGGYGPFPAPNGGPGFCGITVNEGGPPQGLQQLVVYSDYNNPDQVCCLVEANTFQEQVVNAGDVGKVYTFMFDAKLGDIQPNSTAIAFIKVIDNVTFGLSAFETVDMTSIPTTWSSFSLSTTIDASQVGHFFQIGFAATATNYTPSGIVYDNLDFREGLAPGGDSCDQCTPISGLGTFAFDTTAATQDGVGNPACFKFGTSQIDNDVWFCYTAPCNGTYVFSTVGQTTADTKLALYDGVTCPEGSGIIDCNDDTVGVQSEVQGTLVGGQSYLLRVGSFPGAAGTAANFTVSGPDAGATNVCEAGINQDGERTTLKLLGSPRVSDNDVTICANDVSSFSRFGLFVFGDAQQQVPFGSGFLCIDLSSNFNRLVPILTYENQNQVCRTIDLTAAPANVITGGSTWYFQFWYRDFGQTNLSDALCICFSP